MVDKQEYSEQAVPFRPEGLRISSRNGTAEFYQDFVVTGGHTSKGPSIRESATVGREKEVIAGTEDP